MLKKSRDGSVLLLLVLVVSVLSLFCLTAWHSSTLFHDISLVRLVYEQKFRAAQAGLNYGVHICKKQFDQLYALCTENNQDFFIELAPFKISKNIIYTCKINISAGDSENSLSLQSILCEKEEKKCFELFCTILKVTKKDKKLVIKNWNIGDLS